MKKKLITLLIIILSFSNYAQIKFEKGYFIDNANKKVTCWIKNIDWKNNPTKITYKINENEDSKIKEIKAINEFGIYGYSKYQRFVIDIDRSANELNELAEDRKPIFKKEILFLKVLMEGDANLYLYEDGNLRRYFYSVKGLEIAQLVYKQFLDKEGNVKKNERYKQQLWTNLTCNKISKKDIQNIGYNEGDLTNVFSRYNQCTNSKTVKFGTKNKKDFFHLTLRLGISQTKLLLNQPTSELGFYHRVAFFKTEFDNKLGFRFGVEAELIMPFNKNKWAVIIEPTYKSYKTEKTETKLINLSETIEKNVKVDYKYIEVPIGVRYYFFLNDKSKIFINGAYVFSYSFNSSIDDNTRRDPFKIKANANFVFGLGYNYKNMFSLEFRAATNRGLLRDDLEWYSKYKTTSLILGYTIF